jgi:hypothetical protein
LGGIEEKGEGKHWAPPLPLDANRIRTNRKGFQDPLTLEREIHSRSCSLPLVGLQRKEKERDRRIGKSRVHLAEFKFKI